MLIGADSSQKLIAMQDATGAIVISYQTYLVENRAIPVVGIINAPRYGTPKDGKNHPTVVLVPIHQGHIIGTIKLRVVTLFFNTAQSNSIICIMNIYLHSSKKSDTKFSEFRNFLRIVF